MLAELNALPPEEWPTRLRRLVSDQVSLILRRTIDPDRPLSEYGLDSLGNLELRTRIETETGIRITSTDITTVRGLAGSCAKSWRLRRTTCQRRHEATVKVELSDCGAKKEESKLFLGPVEIATIDDWVPGSGP